MKGEGGGQRRLGRDRVSRIYVDPAALQKKRLERHRRQDHHPPRSQKGMGTARPGVGLISPLGT